MSQEGHDLSWEEEMANELAGIDAAGGAEDQSAGHGGPEAEIDDDDFEKELGL